MTQPPNPTIATNSYTYDAQGRRKTWSSGTFTDPSTGTTTSTLTHVFVTDADNREVLEYDGLTGQVLRWYAYGQGPDAMLNEMNVAANTRATPIADIQGSVIGSLDAASGALFKAGSLPFGENTSTTTGRFRFTGRRLDTNTASGAQPSGLYYYRARMYAPGLGRFLQPDPIGYAGGLNVYGYVGNDPLNLLDPLGLASTGGGGGFGPWSALAAVVRGIGDNGGPALETVAGRTVLGAAGLTTAAVTGIVGFSSPTNVGENAALGEAALQRVRDFVMPGGNPIGQ